ARTFREDLFYRLNVVSIHLPPLRDRREDVPALVTHFLAAFAREQKASPKLFSPEALELMVGHRWPGNVRELENAVKRAAALTPTSLVLPDQLPDAVRRGPAAEDQTGGLADFPVDWMRGEIARLGETQDGRLHAHFMACMERPLLAMILRRTGGNQIKAAELLGINRNTLRKRLRDLGIPVPGKEGSSATETRSGA
ncbi:MAG: sigma-54-dependent Fis family transcriptional regulator, partial [Zetaproteobacteria bacterium]